VSKLSANSKAGKPLVALFVEACIPRLGTRELDDFFFLAFLMEKVWDVIIVGAGAAGYFE
jgi:hypothetical protein